MNRYYRIKTTWEPSISGVYGAQDVMTPKEFEDMAMYEKNKRFFQWSDCRQRAEIQVFFNRQQKA
jgi:hypothetical protein